MRLELLPDRSGYSATPLDHTVVTDVRGGLPVTRQDIDDGVYEVQCQFTCDRAKFEYLRSFLDQYYTNPQPFEILLVTELDFGPYPLSNHIAQIVPQSVKFNATKGHTYVVSMTLEAYKQENYWASATYAPSFGESLDLFFSITGARLLGQLYDKWPAEGVELAFSITAAELKNKQDKYDFQEGLDLVFSITGATLRTLLSAYTMQPEGLDLTFTITGAQLRTILIRYEAYQPEGLDLTFAINGATLTP